MQSEDVKIGMKVVPHAKTVNGFGSLNDSSVWKEAQKENRPYLFVCCKDSKYWVLNDSYREGMTPAGDYFNASDFEPYVK